MKLWNRSSWSQAAILPSGNQIVDNGLDYGCDGTLVAVDSANQVFLYTGAGWQQLPGLLSQISVKDASNIWGVYNGVIYHYP